jgi:hypothetical protein
MVDNEAVRKMNDYLSFFQLLIYLESTSIVLIDRAAATTNRLNSVEFFADIIGNYR